MENGVDLVRLKWTLRDPWTPPRKRRGRQRHRSLSCQHPGGASALVASLARPGGNVTGRAIWRQA